MHGTGPLLHTAFLWVPARIISGRKGGALSTIRWISTPSTGTNGLMRSLVHVKCS